ncbi:NAD(P)-binding protein [Dendrothele bispora CBS 962.96]|uniref:NAD(P)-binding protein n=1 Tax=Dendrothele bispora (strain CBS 962.96) TaxID=1314807 RepID=A0A4S8LTF3_DENBC|nr:NAD(P)-binding protein [Dendrothele bispora CBS 962.96]
MTSNPRLIFKKCVGGGLPVVGEHIKFDNTPKIDLDNVPLKGGFLSKTLLLSPEPSMRERMRDPSLPSYTTAYNVGEIITGFGLVVVLRSEREGVKVGDYMYGITTWEAYTVQPYVEGRVDVTKYPPGTFDMDSLALQPVPNPNGMYPLSHYASILGTPGLTGYVGFQGIIQGKEGETIFVSSGASGVGNMVIQLAKSKGMKVIASAGSDIKVEYMRSLGADVPFNYKKESYDSVLAKNGPIHAFWDNVGAEALDAALAHARNYARFAICGTAATDNVPNEERYRLKNAHLIMKKCIKLYGFIVPDFLPQFMGQFLQEVPTMIGQGKLKSKELLVEGIENAAQAIVDMLNSGHDVIGKPVVIVAKE